jgi:hypothetical protein
LLGKNCRPVLLGRDLPAAWRAAEGKYRAYTRPNGGAILSDGTDANRGGNARVPRAHDDPQPYVSKAGQNQQQPTQTSAFAQGWNIPPPCSQERDIPREMQRAYQDMAVDL